MTAEAAVRTALTDDLLEPEFRHQVEDGAHPLTGHCYVASEALWHLLGGQKSGLRPMQLEHEGVSHWWLEGPRGGVYDLTAAQFRTPVPYEEGQHRAFLEPTPSRRARTVLRRARRAANPGAQAEGPKEEIGDPDLLYPELFEMARGALEAQVELPLARQAYARRETQAGAERIEGLQDAPADLNERVEGWLQQIETAVGEPAANKLRRRLKADLAPVRKELSALVEEKVITDVFPGKFVQPIRGTHANIKLDAHFSVADPAGRPLPPKEWPAKAAAMERQLLDLVLNKPIKTPVGTLVLTEYQSQPKPLTKGIPRGVTLTLTGTLEGRRPFYRLDGLHAAADAVRKILAASEIRSATSHGADLSFVSERAPNIGRLKRRLSK